MNVEPCNNTKLIGYNDLLLDLKDLYDKKALPNKIIFSGQSGIGKATLSYHLFNYIFSIDEEKKYDYNKNIISEENSSFKLISQNTHPNFYLITNDEDKTNIQISKIRDMINFCNKSSFNNKSKIILIDNIEYLNKSSINALLKIIEEPSENTFFFLIHNNKFKILDTLKSRCIKFNLHLCENDIQKINNTHMVKDFYTNLNNDFKNYYMTPGDLFILKQQFEECEIDEHISIEELIKQIINQSLYKKSVTIKKKLSCFIELYFNKKISSHKSKVYIYSVYKYFLKKIADCNKYNLDLEPVLIELNNKIINE